MVSCFRYTWISIPTFLLISAIVFGSMAITGSIRTGSPTGQTYLMKLDLSDINLERGFNLTQSDIDEFGISNDDVKSVLEFLGIKQVYSFGLWNYCSGSNINGTYRVEHCSKSTPLYIFNPYEVIKSTLHDISIELPKDVQDYLGIMESGTKLIYITSIVGVCLAFITLLLTIWSFWSKLLSCFSLVLGILSTLSTTIAAAGSTGVFLILTGNFHDNAEEFGIDVGLGNYYFYAFIWTAVFCSLNAALFNTIAICCGRTKKANRDSNEEQIPMMVYSQQPYR